MEKSTVLVMGGGPVGIEKALELAQAGNMVYLVERAPGIGGETISLDGKEGAAIFLPAKLEEAKKHPSIQVITCAELEKVEGKDGRFKVRLRRKPRRVLDERCNACKACIKVCPINMWDDFNQALCFRTAIDYFSSDGKAFGIIKETPICQATCPVNLDIRGYIGLIADGKYEESLGLIRERLPFPAIIGRICPHPCEEKCNRGRVDHPLSIRCLKRYVADYVAQKAIELEVPQVRPRPEKVAIIGAGPSGLACAHDLALKGYPVTVFEALPVAGGMLAVGIPEYRLPRDVLNAEIAYVRKLGVEVKTNTPIGKELTLDDLFQQGYKAVFLAVGAHTSQKLRIPNEEAEGVVHGVNFLRDLNLGRPVRVGQKVGIIGGGNVAMDAARSSLRLRAKAVTIIYRRSRQEMPASDEEIAAAEAEGIKFEYLVAPSEVVVSNGKVTALRCTRMRLGEPDASGRRRPIPIEGSEFDIELDMLIPAIGQASDLSFISKDSGIEVTRWGTIATDPETQATSRPGVFAGGDAVTGPGIAIEAIAAGKRAAASIDRYLSGEQAAPLRRPEPALAEERQRYIVEFPDIPAGRRHMEELPVVERVSNFKEVELGFTEEMAQAEARRCLSCRRCLGCALCWAECKPEAIVFEQEAEEFELTVDRIVVAPPVLKAPAAVDRKLGHGKHANLVTDLEFERMLSPGGPYGGLLLRPYDGEIPKRVAFIHNLSLTGSKGEAAFRSLANLVKLAALAQSKVADLEMTLLVGSLGDYERPFKEMQAKVPRLTVKTAEELSIEEVGDTKNLAVSGKDGRQGEPFDMVVVATLLAMPEEIGRLSQQLELGIERQAFCEREGTTEVAASKSGLSYSGWAPL